MRLGGVFYTLDGRVAEIKLRVSAIDLPPGTHVRISDIQLQQGEMGTGFVPNPAEAGVETVPTVQYRNGVVTEDMDVVVLANLDRATPTRIGVRDAMGDTRIGSYRFGQVSGSADAFGDSHSATHGYGRVPVVTERSDLPMVCSVEGRAHLRMSWQERRPPIE